LSPSACTTSTVRSEQRIGLVDVNNFDISCERLFDPKLVGRLVVVLSNNDGYQWSTYCPLPPGLATACFQKAR
jgi:hypothetical protein